jgi:hypothetical protein
MNHIVGQALLDAERGHLVRLLVWALASMLAGAVCIAWRRRAAAPDFWLHAGIQSAAWGAVDLGIVALAWSGLTPRDLGGAIALDRFLWLNVGLDVGYAMVGATLVILGLRAPKRLGLVGAGAAVIVQGVALAALDLVLSARIVHPA